MSVGEEHRSTIARPISPSLACCLNQPCNLGFSQILPLSVGSVGLATRECSICCSCAASAIGDFSSDCAICLWRVFDFSRLYEHLVPWRQASSRERRRCGDDLPSLSNQPFTMNVKVSVSEYADCSSGNLAELVALSPDLGLDCFYC